MSQDETEKIGGLPVDDAGLLFPCLIVLSGLSLGKTFRLERGNSTLGRAEDSDILLTDRGISRQHARFEVSPEGVVTLEDLGSTNGTYVGAEKVRTLQLSGGERLRFGSGVKMRFDFRDPQEESLLGWATRDPLTGALNRRYFDQRLAEAIARSRRHGSVLCCAFIDADLFKNVNDVHGHGAGDQVLKELVKRALKHKREEDVFARFGGEEFVLLLPSTALEGAAQVLERIRQSVESKPFKVDSLKGAEEISVTISIGLARSEGQMDGEGLLRAADEALLEAKDAGRNQLVVYREPQ